MTDEDDKKPKDAQDVGGYRESPPDAPAPAPVQPTEYQQQLQTQAEVQKFQQQVRGPSKGTKIAAVGGIGCMAVVLWALAIAGVGVVVVIGLVIFTCSR